MARFPAFINITVARGYLNVCFDERNHELRTYIAEHAAVIINWGRINLHNYEMARLLIILFKNKVDQVRLFESSFLQSYDNGPQFNLNHFLRIVSLDVEYYFETPDKGIGFLRKQIEKRVTAIASEIRLLELTANFWNNSFLRDRDYVRRLLYLFTQSEDILIQYERSLFGKMKDMNFIRMMDSESCCLCVIEPDDVTYHRLRISDDEERWTAKRLEQYDMCVNMVLMNLDVPSNSVERMFIVNQEYEERHFTENRTKLIIKVTTEEPEANKHFDRSDRWCFNHDVTTDHSNPPPLCHMCPVYSLYSKVFIHVWTDSYGVQQLVPQAHTSQQYVEPPRRARGRVPLYERKSSYPHGFAHNIQNQFQFQPTAYYPPQFNHGNIPIHHNILHQPQFHYHLQPNYDHNMAAMYEPQAQFQMDFAHRQAMSQHEQAQFMIQQQYQRQIQHHENVQQPYDQQPYAHRQAMAQHEQAQFMIQQLYQQQIQHHENVQQPYDLRQQAYYEQQQRQRRAMHAILQQALYEQDPQENGDYHWYIQMDDPVFAEFPNRRSPDNQQRNLVDVPQHHRLRRMPPAGLHADDRTNSGQFRNHNNAQVVAGFVNRPPQPNGVPMNGFNGIGQVRDAAMAMPPETAFQAPRRGNAVASSSTSSTSPKLNGDPDDASNHNGFRI